MIIYTSLSRSFAHPFSDHCVIEQANSIELEIKSLMECVRTVTPAMLVVLSWAYVLLANINMVGLSSVDQHVYRGWSCPINVVDSALFIIMSCFAGVFQLLQAGGQLVPGKGAECAVLRL